MRPMLVLYSYKRCAVASFPDREEGLTRPVVGHIFDLHATRRTPDPKLCALADSGTVNPHPEAVRDPGFAGSDFFDPRDLVQVKYEMLRRVRVEHACIAEVAEQFGLSRPTFYKAQADFARAGLTGLLPGKRGPRGAHKLTPEVLQLHRAGTGRGGGTRCAGARRADCPTLRLLGASAHRGARLGAGEKKTLMHRRLPPLPVPDGQPWPRTMRRCARRPSRSAARRACPRVPC